MVSAQMAMDTGVQREETEQETVHRLIRSAGGRLTVPTRILISVLSDADEHLTADDLIEEVGRRAPGVAPSTIYRVLQRLDELQIVEHVHSGAGPAFYHLRRHGHAHLVCSGCGAIVDIPDAAFEELCRTSRRTLGFTIDPHHSALLGRCGACSR